MIDKSTGCSTTHEYIVDDVRWYVEHQKNNDCVVIGETEPNQSVYLFKCDNSTVQVIEILGKYKILRH